MRRTPTISSPESLPPTIAYRNPIRRNLNVAGVPSSIAHGEPSEEEKRLKHDKFNALVAAVGGRAARSYEWERFTGNFRPKQNDRLRVFQPVRSHFLRRSHQIIGSQRDEMVYIKEPSNRSGNFMKIDPRRQFANNVHSDPISVTHHNQWGRIGQYFTIAAKPYAVHISIKKKLTDHARELLLTRILEHAKSKDVRNPRLVGVFKRGSKKLVRAIFNSNQLRNENFETLIVRLKKEIRRMKHLILRQDSAGGKFHQRVADDDLL